MTTHGETPVSCPGFLSVQLRYPSPNGLVEAFTQMLANTWFFSNDAVALLTPWLVVTLRSRKRH